MAVFHIEKTRDYTVMSNYHLRDMSLSLKAKGLLSHILPSGSMWLLPDYQYAKTGNIEIAKGRNLQLAC